MRIIGIVTELLTIAFGFFVVGKLLNITGVGVKLYGVERAQGTYVVEFFLGMACGAAFIQTAAYLVNASFMGVVAQSLLPSVFGYLAFLVAIWVMGVQEVLITSVAGSLNELVGLFIVAALFIGCLVAAVLLQKASLNIRTGTWQTAVISCVVGVLWAIYLAPQGASKIAVTACFIVGFVIYTLARVWGGRLSSMAAQSI